MRLYDAYIYLYNKPHNCVKTEMYLAQLFEVPKHRSRVDGQQKPITLKLLQWLQIYLEEIHNFVSDLTLKVIE